MMDLEILKASNLLPSTYIQQTIDAAKSTENIIHNLLQHKKLPVEGWSSTIVETFLGQLSAMDSNNFRSNCGVGEREARFASEIVARRHFRFGHGVGRSGDLTETQPKAAGSSLMAKLTNYMLSDLLHIMGIQEKVYCLLAPVATGMSLVLTMLSFRSQRPNAKYIIWSRIDQKACFKSILTAGFEPIIIDMIVNGSALETNIEEINTKIKELCAENILCVMTTTSCFAPRSCDSIEAVAKICKEYTIPHLVNNAYGLQSSFYIRRIQKANRKGRVDVFIQSTDKNLMVPVGGTIIASFDKSLLDAIAQIYPGRASSTPMLDVFITLLNIGKNGYESLVKTRETLYSYLCDKLETIATKYNEKVLISAENSISIGLSLSNMEEDQLTKIGSMLFIKNVSGARVITTKEIKNISGFNFTGWGAHCKSYTTPYLTCAASIGITKDDIDTFIKRLDKVLSKIKNKVNISTSEISSKRTL